MTIKRTPDIDESVDFDVVVPITKSYVDTQTGKRYITGVATGVAEDRDGERCSVNCVKSMGKQIEQGGVKATSSHQQDWMTEIGEIHKAAYDPDTDELSIEAVLPPEGHDAIADKAFKVANTEKVGWSIGGKLLKHFYERNEVGKKRKVLDAIHLKHVALTKNPSYASSFATAVAKSYTGDDADTVPDDAEFTLEQDTSVEKDMTTGSWVNGGSDSGGGNTGRDSRGSGPRNSGSNKGGAKMRTDTPVKDTSEDDSDSDADDGKDNLPEGKDQQRHLACPNCGHEFAADLPVDRDEKQIDDQSNQDDDEDNDDDSDTGKSTTSTVTNPPAKEPTVSKVLADALDELKRFADADVTKTEDAPEGDVTKTTADDDLSDIEKMVAASHQVAKSRLDGLDESVSEGFALIAKSLKELQNRFDELPTGRKSVARTLPPSVGHDDGETVGKTVQQAIDEAPDAVSALKIMNAAAGLTR